MTKPRLLPWRAVSLLGFALLLFPFGRLAAQTDESASTPSVQSTHIGGYGELAYNHADSATTLNIPRLVLFVSHQFNPKWSFKSELEVENTKVEGAKVGGEFEVEQALIDYQVSDHFGLRGGLMLIPSGIINQTHEPPTFYSVGRPHTDQQVIPSTWRQLGLAVHGELGEIVEYQAMIGEGLSAAGYDATGIYEGRQDGANAQVGSPGLALKLDLLPVLGLRIGGSIYYQTNTASTLNLIDPITNLPGAVTSSLSVTALDARYDIGTLHFRGEFATDAIGNSLELSKRMTQVIPKAVTGGYLEAAWNVVPMFSSTSDLELLPFVRYETLHHSYEPSVASDQDIAYVMVGIAAKPVDGVILKANYEVANKSEFAVTENEFMTKQLFSLELGYAF